ncbi:hypothetical protein SmJEL517_g03118 [Synchytrium microbalum]|uniref:Transcription elongation factor Spt6 n=1 Tax=Synchytrium microbalum TaxID=1806994 RepID=A0A507C825_9FUNG|nr:uncharacterized protein SmJEL517_g03118 [Synchytrium microbalum]TPX34146.1 hypothetical protein SmJEL517_g03118 [Synchytrium microbalum]
MEEGEVRPEESDPDDIHLEPVPRSNEEQAANGKKRKKKVDEDEEGEDTMRPSKSNPGIYSDDDEDEDEEQQEGDEELGSFIADDDEEVADGQERRRKKRRKKVRTIEDELDEEDMDLVRENMGEGEFKRLRRVVDEEKGDDDMHRMFDDDEAGEGEGDRQAMDIDMDEDSDDGFVVNDEGDDENERPRPKAVKRARGMPSGISNEKYDDLMDIFGDYSDYDYHFTQGEEEAEKEQEEVLDEYGEPVPDKSKKEKKLASVFEPAALSRLMLTDRDTEIERTDLPERFQLLEQRMDLGPWAAESRDEMTDEAEWIARKIYAQRPQNVVASVDEHRMDPNLIDAVHYTVKSLRDKDDGGYEVPHIARYGKDPIAHAWTLTDGSAKGLRLSDLWRIFDLDREYRVFSARRRKLKTLLEGVQHGLPEDELAVINQYLENAQTSELLADLHRRITLVYPAVVQEVMGVDSSRTSKVQQLDKWTKGGITTFSKSYDIDLGTFVRELQFAVKYHEPSDPDKFPEDVASEYITASVYNNAPIIMAEAENYLVLLMSTDPSLRSWARAKFESKAALSFKPSVKGKDTIDPDHPFWQFKYLQRKPLRQVVSEEDYNMVILMFAAEQQGLGQIIVESEDTRFLETVEAAICNESYKEVSGKWNERRRIVARRAFQDVMLPEFASHLKSTLLKDARESLAKTIEKIMSEKVGMAGYMPYRSDDEDLRNTFEDDPPRVLALTLVGEFNPSLKGVVIDEDGLLKEHWSIPNVLTREEANGYSHLVMLRHGTPANSEFARKLASINPEFIAIAGSSPQLPRLFDVLEKILQGLKDSNDAEVYIRKTPQYQFVEDDAARIYRNSPRSRSEFPSLDDDGRYLVSLARKVQDPTMEYAGLMNTETEYRSLRLHRLQQYLPDDQMQDCLERAFVNAVNLCGCDINDAVIHPHRAYTLQFVAGFGPRKARKTLERIRNKRTCVYSRNELLTEQYMGGGRHAKTIFNNCSGSIRIRRRHWEDSSKTPAEDVILDILDDTRIHPRNYQWARKIAAAALEVEEQEDHLNPSGAVEDLMEIMKGQDGTTPLDDLDLESYSQTTAELSRLLLVLYDIRSELKHPFAELRSHWEGATKTQVFNMITKEIVGTTVKENMVVEGTVYRTSGPYVRARIGGGDLVGIAAKDDYPDLKDAQIGETLNFKIDKIDDACLNAFCLNLQLMSHTDMQKHRSGDDTRPEVFWDRLVEIDDIEHREKAQMTRKRKFIPRSIKHADFQNVESADAINYLAPQLRGNFVFRPSSKGPKYLILTWKVDDGIYGHIEVEEGDKQPTNFLALGKTLKIGTSSFTELDEIVSTYLNPLIHMTNEILDSKKFQRITYDEAESFLELECVKNSRSNYVLIPADRKPGAFYFVYKHPSNRVHRDAVLVFPTHFEFRNKQIKPPLVRLFDEWKLQEMTRMEADKTAARAKAKEAAAQQVPIPPVNNNPLFGGGGRPAPARNPNYGQQPSYQQQQQQQQQPYVPVAVAAGHWGNSDWSGQPDYNNQASYPAAGGGFADRYDQRQNQPPPPPPRYNQRNQQQQQQYGGQGGGRWNNSNNSTGPSGGYGAGYGPSGAASGYGAAPNNQNGRDNYRETMSSAGGFATVTPQQQYGAQYGQMSGGWGAPQQQQQTYGNIPPQQQGYGPSDWGSTATTQLQQQGEWGGAAAQQLPQQAEWGSTAASQQQQPTGAWGAS